MGCIVLICFHLGDFAVEDDFEVEFHLISFFDWKCEIMMQVCLKKDNEACI